MKTHLLLDSNVINSFFLRMAMIVFIVVVTTTISNATTYTWNRTAGGSWTTTTYWTPNTPAGGPPSGSDVIINSNQSGSIIAVPTISLDGLTVTGNCLLVPSAGGNTLTITGTFSVSSGISLTFGVAGNNSLNLILTSTCTGTIGAGVTIVQYGIFTNSGNLTNSGNVQLNGLTINAGMFIIESGANLNVLNTLTNNAGTSGLVINDGGSLIYGSGTPSGTIKRLVTAGTEGSNSSPPSGYHFMSSPITSTTFGEVFNCTDDSCRCIYA